MMQKAPRQVMTTPDRASKPTENDKRLADGLYHILLLVDKEEIL